MAFAHLRVQSSHSAFSGAITPMGLAKGCKARGMAAAALTDTGTTAAVVQWKKAAEKSGIRPIFGAILWLKPENRTLVEGVVGMPRLVEEPGSLLLLVETVEGWENLSVLCSLGSRDVWLQPRVTWEQVGLHALGLHAIVPFDHGRLDAEMAERLNALFPSRWGAEVFDHGEGWEGSRRDVRRPLALGSPYGEIGTNAVRYLDPTDVVALHALRCTGLGATLDSVGDWVPQSDQAYLCDEAEMRDRLGDAPVDAAGSLAERLTFVPTMKGYHFPKSEPASDASPAERWAWLQDWFPLPGDLRGEPVPYPLDVDTATGELEAWFAVVARRGLEGRLAKDPSLDRDLYVARLETEIKLICEMKFPAYMLIVAEFIVWAKDRKVPVGPGRGSVAGSLVAWAMRITEVDSLRFTLLFERFLNPARVSMPDVDVDFGQALRESVIEHMRDRYGREHVGQISNFGTFKPKSAIKDMLRGLGVMFKDANRITGASDDDKASSVTTVVEETDSLRKLYHLDPVFRRAVKLSVMLVRAGEKPTDKPDALLRQRGVHAAGVVVAPRPLSVYAPVFHDAESGRDVLSVDMDGTEVLGLIKFDFLGLKTLDVIEEALDHVERLTGTRPDMDAVPLDDPEVFEVLASGDVQGLFQVESDGMKGYLQQLQPDHVEDVIAMLALYRPGPLGSGMVEDFIERKRGRQEVVHLHPLLEPILRATYGVLVYQESILQAAQVLAGFSLGHADLLRRAIGKKKPEEIAAQKKGFVDGCLATNGIPVEESTRIFGLIEKFAEYGFNRSHSAAYGLITYRTAWLKAHHRVAFLAACASWEGNAHEALSKVLNDASRVGIGILPPDVHHSGPRFTIETEGEKMALRYGLGAIKGLGTAGLVSIQSALEEQPFSDLGDFATRTELDSGSIKALVEAGALDGIVSRRDFAMPHLSEWRDAVEDQEKAHTKLCKSLTRAHEKEKKSSEKEAAKGAKKQVGMFAPPPAAPTELALPSAPPPLSFSAVSPVVPQEKRWTWLGRLAKEQKAIGVVLSGSPMLRWGDLAEGLQTHRISEMASAPPRIPIALCAVVRAVHEHRTKTGTSIGFVLLVDDSGRTEVTLFSNVLHASKAALKVGTGVLVRGTMDRPGPTGILIAGSVEDLDQVRARGTRLIRLGRAGTPLGVDPEALDGVLALHPGTCPVRVNGQTDVTWKPILEARQVIAGGALFDDLERTFGMPGAARSIV